MSTETTDEAPLDDEAILKGLAPVAAAMGMPAAELLAQLRTEAGEQERPGTPLDGRWACIAFMGHNEYTGYVTETVKHGQPAYRVDLPERLWGGNPDAYVEYAASAWFSERPRSEESVRKAWESQVRAAAERARREAEWAREREQRALEAGADHDPDLDDGDGEAACR